MIFPPHLIRRAIAARANQMIWEDHAKSGHDLWISDQDMEFCGNLLSKSLADLTDKEVLTVEMLALKYSDKPCDADLAKSRVLN